MIRFETESGSSYELDEANRRIRRLSGKRPPHRSQPPDGEWKSYIAISTVHVGRRLAVSWEFDDTVFTSRIARILS